MDHDGFMVLLALFNLTQETHFSYFTTGEPSPDAGEGVEEVRRCVAPVIQHLVEGEDVVVDAVVGQVGVFDAAESDRPLGLAELLRGQNLQGHSLSLRS